MIRSMKDSKIEWAGKIPEHWREIPNKFLFYNSSEKVGCEAEHYQLLSLTTQGVKKKDKNATGGKVPLSYNTYQTVDVGDIIFCLFDLDCSAVFAGVSPYCGMITSAYDVLTPRDAVLYNKYADYWFQYAFSNRYYKLYSKNIRFAVTNDIFGSILTLVPPLAEQKKIADFLDGKCAEIDELVQTEEKMIEELKAYKQSVITEAVTKGLDPSAPMKDSGIEWIGKIPECWEIMTLKSLFDFGKGLPITKEDLRVSGEKVISYGQIHAKFNISTRIVDDMYRFVDSVYVDSHSNSIVKVGDFIFADTSEDLSGVGDFVYINDNDVIFAGYHSIILKSRMTTSNKYLAYLFLSDCWRSQLRSRVFGIKVFSISKNILSRVAVLFPSDSEQQKIADYLDDKCAKIDEMIAIRNEQIYQLKDYKKSLIYEYVTGKKEVV